MSKEPKELFRSILSNPKDSSETEVVISIPENVYECLTEEQIEEVYIKVAEISHYMCNCIVDNSKK